MHTNAIESWLARMHRHMRSTGRNVDWRFHVQVVEPGALEASYPECRSLIIRSPHALRDWRAFFASFGQLCRAERFDVVHIHADLMSAPYLVAAHLAGVPRAVVHVHNADEHLPVRPSRRRVLKEPFRRVCLAMADRVVGISDHTLDTFLHGRRRRTGRDIVHHYGVDPTPFQRTSDRSALRSELQLTDDAVILLFAGRLVPEKNPVFVLEVLAELRKSEHRAVAVFAGAGSLETSIRARAEELGVRDAVRLIGWRSDVPEIMCASDCFILPHPEHPVEGFGIAVVEAQLAGLRLLVSKGILPDPLLPTAVLQQLPLSAGAEQWAHAARSLLASEVPVRQRAFAALASSAMNMERAAQAMLQLYE